VKIVRALAAPLSIATVLSLAGCLTPRTTTSPAPEAPSTAALPPPVPQATPDAVPRVEPRSRYGNPPFYDIFGKRYYVLSSSVAYVERGVASWYGPGFHHVKTSNGETYDMYGMTAAHRTLPLPAYVRVTNLQNGRSVVVRVNDRGPFVGNRIIDLSYTAASRLDMLRTGTAMVEVRAIDPTAPAQTLAGPLLAAAPPSTAGSSAPPAAARDSTAAARDSTAGAAATPSAGTSVNLASASGVSVGVTPASTAPGVAPSVPPVPTSVTAPQAGAATASTAPAPAAGGRAPLFVQAGAFSDPANAEHLAAKLRGGAFGKIFVRDDVIAGRRMYRVRIGPVPNVPEFDRIVAALERAGVHDAHLALE
jgi:rare lipoprotein A